LIHAWIGYRRQADKSDCNPERLPVDACFSEGFSLQSCWCVDSPSRSIICARSLLRVQLQGVSPMKTYIFSLLAGVLVGVIYSLIHVRSPAPPLVALVGLLGILAGEQIIPVGKQMLSGTGFHVAWQQSKCNQHMFGSLPGRNTGDTARVASANLPEKRS
jgi:XapX domain-containing protein